MRLSARRIELKIGPRIERRRHEGWRNRWRIGSGKLSSRFVGIEDDKTRQWRSEGHEKVVERKIREEEMRIFHNAARILAEALPLSETVEAKEVRILRRIVRARRIRDIGGGLYLLIERIAIARKRSVSTPVKVPRKLLEIRISRERLDVGTLSLHIETLARRRRVPVENHQIV